MCRWNYKMRYQKVQHLIGFLSFCLNLTIWRSHISIFYIVQKAKDCFVKDDQLSDCEIILWMQYQMFVI